MLFYFTATGNSLYVAKKLSEKPISIPQIMNSDTEAFSDETIGIVCPVYAGDVPKMVKRFLRDTRFDTDYFYVILTYGLDESDSPEFLYRECEKYGLYIDYIDTVKMVDNYLPAFDMDEEKKLDKNEDEQIAAVLKNISERKRQIPVATPEGIKLHKKVALMNKLTPSFNNGKQIEVSDLCVGCGICSRVCPIGNFYIEDGKAKRKSQTCEFCLSCIHNCPQKAIKLKKAEKNPNARYRNEHIPLKEIIRANCQMSDEKRGDFHE